PMLRIVPLEGDQLDIGAVRECDQRVVRPGRMRAARDDREAELGIVADRRAELANHDHDVIDCLQSHDGRSGAAGGQYLGASRGSRRGTQIRSRSLSGTRGWGQGSGPCRSIRSALHSSRTAGLFGVNLPLTLTDTPATYAGRR